MKGPHTYEDLATRHARVHSPPAEPFIVDTVMLNGVAMTISLAILTTISPTRPSSTVVVGGTSNRTSAGGGIQWVWSQRLGVVTQKGCGYLG